jgi:hypothetical protein
VRVTLQEDAEVHRHLGVLGRTDPADHAAIAHDGAGGLDGLVEPDAFEYPVGAIASGQLADFLDPCFASLGNDVGGPELEAEVGTVLVAAHEDDPFGPQTLGPKDRGEPNRPVADHGDGRAGVDAARVGAVIARRKDVEEAQQGCQEGGILADRELDQGALSLGHPHRLALTTVDPVAGPHAAVPAGGLQALLAEVASVVRPDEGSDDQVTSLEPGHLGTDVLDSAEELVPDALAVVGRGHGSIGPQVAAADAGAHDAHDRVSRLLQLRVGDVLHLDVSGTVNDGCSHGSSFPDVSLSFDASDPDVGARRTTARVEKLCVLVWDCCGDTAVCGVRGDR